MERRSGNVRSKVRCIVALGVLLVASSHSGAQQVDLLPIDYEWVPFEMMAAPTESDLEVSGGVIDAPNFDIRERITPKRIDQFWRYTRVEGIEILSSAADHRTSEIVEDLCRFRSALKSLLPILDRGMKRGFYLILCDDRAQFRRFMPGEKFTPESEVASIVESDADGACVVVDITFNPENLQRRLYRAYSLLLLKQLEPEIPAALAEGFARVFSITRLFERSAVFGALRVTPQRIVKYNWAGATVRLREDRDEVSFFFQGKGLRDLVELMSVSYADPELKYPINSPVALQSFAFVHMCLFGRDRDRARHVLDLLRNLAGAEPSQKRIEASFGENIASLNKALRDYIDAPNYVFEAGGEFAAEDVSSLRAELMKPGPHKRGEYRKKYDVLEIPVDYLPDPAVRCVPAVPRDVARMVGCALRLVGQYDEAREIHLAAIHANRTDPDLNAGMGYVERAAGVSGTARHYLSLAAKLGVRDAGPYVWFAEARIDRAVVEGKFIEAPEAASILRLLLHARSTSIVPRSEVYRNLARLWLRVNFRAPPSYLAILHEGAAAFPWDLDLRLCLADVFARHGMPDDALSLLTKLELSEVCAEDRERLRVAQTMLELSRVRAAQQK